MERTLNILKALALTAFSVLCIVLGVLAFQLSAAVSHLDQESASLAGSASHVLDGFNAIGIKAQTTVAESNKLINDARFSVSEVNRNVLAERKLYEQTVPELTGQASSALHNVETDAADLHPLLLSATARTNDLAPIEQNLATAAGHLDASGTAALDQLTVVETHADTLITSPSVADTLTNVAGSTTSLNHMLFTADAVETKYTHDYLHPSKNPLVRTWKATEPFLLPVAQIGAVAATIAAK